MMNFDRIIDFKPVDAFRDSELIGRLSQKVEEYNKRRFNLSDFSDRFGEDAVHEDEQVVTSLREKFKNNLAKEKERYPDDPNLEDIEKIGSITEYLVGNNIGTWFANKVEAHPTSEFDDYKNSIDLVLEYKNAPESSRYLGLGIDVTFTTNKNIIRKKLDRIWDYDLREGKAPTVKYFESKEKGVRGRLELPRVLVAIDPRMVKELMRLQDNGKQKEIDNHAVQIVIMYQLQTQFMEFYKRVISREGRGYEKLAEMYRNAVDQFNEIISEKEDYIAQNQHVLSDDQGARLVSEYFQEKKS